MQDRQKEYQNEIERQRKFMEENNIYKNIDNIIIDNINMNFDFIDFGNNNSFKQDNNLMTIQF